MGVSVLRAEQAAGGGNKEVWRWSEAGVYAAVC